MEDDIFNVDVSEFVEADEGQDQTETVEDDAETVDDDNGSVEDNGTEGEGAGSDTYDLKYLGETKQVSREEVIELAQKGMDYDRQRERAESSKSELDGLRKYKTENDSTIAEIKAYMSEVGSENLSELLDELRVGKLVAGGMNRETATERVARERAERALKLATDREAENGKADKQNEQAQKDVADFRAAHPDVDLKELLPKLKEDLEATKNLSAAYDRYENRRLTEENKRLQEQLASKEKDSDNKRRAPGSQKAAGSDKPNDLFMEIMSTY